MRRHKLLAAIIVFLSVPNESSAADDLYTKQFAMCMDKSGGVTAKMLSCIATETRTQDARLNGAYKKLVGQLTASRKSQLVEVQRMWIKYRDANCTFYADPDGGTNAVVSASDCAMSATASRAKELENLAE